MIKVLLWDIDGTLLNFEKAERQAIGTCFSLFGLGECTEEMLARYSAINSSYWKRLERGELTKQEVLLGRFQEFFGQEGIPVDKWYYGSEEQIKGGEIADTREEHPETGLIAAFNKEYQVRLGDTIHFNDHGYELVKDLKSKVKQYAATNGTFIAQERKLKKSGLEELLEGAFISDNIGIEKPSQGFFDYVFEQIGPYGKDEVMIVGDSLTSDMQGGNNAGIVCCWYNPKGEAKDKNLRIDYEIENLQQVRDILNVTVQPWQIKRANHACMNEHVM